MKTIRKTSSHRAKPAGKHLIVFGAGGNIGSHLVPLLARLAGVGRLTLVDFDRYEDKNLQAQDISPAEVGRAKATVQAGRARRINPKLEVKAIVGRIENIPLGWLRGDVILAGLDSKESRRDANEIAWRLGVPWIDAGVEPSQMLVRLNVYRPALDQPCLECAWDERDYGELATIHPCDPGAAKNPATNAPACLGALAASLTAIECQKLLKGQTADLLTGRQLLIDTATHKLFVTTFRRNPNCRFNHATWKIFQLRQSPAELSVGATLNLWLKSKSSQTLAFGEISIVKQLDCPDCGFARGGLFRLQNRLRNRERYCDRCGSAMLAAGFHMKTRLAHADLGLKDADRSLSSLGLHAGDVISLTNGADQKFFELGEGNSHHAPSQPQRKRRRP